MVKKKGGGTFQTCLNPTVINVCRENLSVKILSGFQSVCFYSYESGSFERSIYIYMCVLYWCDLTL